MVEKHVPALFLELFVAFSEGEPSFNQHIFIYISNILISNSFKEAIVTFNKISCPKISTKTKFYIHTNI